MKKILLASTILAGTAGFAAADNANFTFSGEAYVGAAFTMNFDEGVGEDWDGNGVTGEADVEFFRMETTSSFTAAMMTTTDGGLEAGASITIDAKGASVESDHTEGAFGQDSFDNAGGISNTSAYLSGEWGKVAVAYDNDGTNQIGTSTLDWYDTTVTYSHTFGDFAVEAFVVVAPLGESNGDIGIKGTYSFADYSVYAWVEYDQDNVAGDAAAVDTGDYEVGFGGSASMSGFTLDVAAEYDAYVGVDDWDWMAKASYGMDAWSVGAFVEDDGVDDEIDFGVNASYDLGGGVSVDAAYIYDDDTEASVAKIGVSMAF